MVKRKHAVPPKDWNKQKPIERQLADSLHILTVRVEKIANEYNSLAEITAAISQITQYPVWKRYALEQAVKMSRMVAVQNAKTWREAAAKGQRSREIYQALRAEMATNARFIEQVRKNAEAITSLPDDISRHITKHASTVALRGERAAVLVPKIREAAPELSEARINLIARTETAKTQAAVTEIRSQQVGVDWYIWKTSEDQRVRSSHKHMLGVACQFSSPPSPEALKGEPSVGYYGPGGIWNCRCYAAPVIDTEFLPARIKVVQQGRIVSMTRKQFEKIQ